MAHFTFVHNVFLSTVSESTCVKGVVVMHFYILRLDTFKNVITGELAMTDATPGQIKVRGKNNFGKGKILSLSTSNIRLGFLTRE